MYLVIDAGNLSVHGLEQPLPVSDIEERAVYFCLKEKKPAEAKASLDASIEIASSSGSVQTKAKLETVGPGPASNEFELAIRFKRLSQKARAALAKVSEAFGAAHRFLPSVTSGQPDKPETLAVLEKLQGQPADADIDEVAFSRALATTLSLPYADLEVTGVDVLQVRDFTRAFLLDSLLLPLGREGKHTKIAIGRIPAPRAVAALKRRYSTALRYVVAPSYQIISGIETAYQIRSNRRRSARIAVALRVRVGMYAENWELAAGPVEGTTRNVSTGGVLLVAQPLREPPEEMIGRRAGLLIYLPEYSKPLRAAGRFLRAKAVSGPASVLHSYAVELNYMPREDRRRLDVFRYTLLWGPRRLKVEE